MHLTNIYLTTTVTFLLSKKHTNTPCHAFSASKPVRNITNNATKGLCVVAQYGYETSTLERILGYVECIV